MLKRFDDKFVKGDYLNFTDKGIAVKNGTTRTHAVHSRYNQSLLGHVKWFAQWRQYVFFPLNCILNKDCLREAADFCDEVTTAHRMKRTAFPAST